MINSPGISPRTVQKRRRPCGKDAKRGRKGVVAAKRKVPENGGGLRPRSEDALLGEG